VHLETLRQTQAVDLHRYFRRSVLQVVDLEMGTLLMAALLVQAVQAVAVMAELEVRVG
jgi:hypothetical protein